MRIGSVFPGPPQSPSPARPGKKKANGGSRRARALGALTLLGLLVLTAVLGTGGWAAESPPAPARQRSGGLEALVVVPAAPLVDLAATRDRQGRPGLALLTLGPGGDKGQPGELLFLPAGADTLEPLVRGLPPGLTSLAATDSVLFAGLPGKVYRFGADGTPIVAANGTGLDLRSVEGGRRGTDDELVVARAGRITRYDLAGESLVAALGVNLPVTAERALFGLRISSPPVTRLSATAAAGAVALAGPLETGTRRLQTQVVDLARGASHEAWSLLPGDERLIGSTFDRLGDRPVLLAVTIGQLGLLVDKQVRVFSLPADRTRRGVPPLLAFETGCPLWGSLTNHLADTDGDGADDLVTIHTRGLSGDTLVVEVRRGRPSGGFEVAPRRIELGVEAADWHYEDDWTGDGQLDLLVLTGRELRLYPGTPEARRPVANRPSATLATIPAGWRDGGQRQRSLELGTRGATFEERGPQLVPLDLDHDGANEVVAVVPVKEKGTAVAVVSRTAGRRAE